MIVKVELNNFEDFVGNKDSIVLEDIVKKCYVLFLEVGFIVFLLLSDFFDCRLLGDLMVLKDVLILSLLEIILWERYVKGRVKEKCRGIG